MNLLCTKLKNISFIYILHNKYERCVQFCNTQCLQSIDRKVLNSVLAQHFLCLCYMWEQGEAKNKDIPKSLFKPSPWQRSPNKRILRLTQLYIPLGWSHPIGQCGWYQRYVNVLYYFLLDCYLVILDCYLILRRQYG